MYYVYRQVLQIETRLNSLRTVGNYRQEGARRIKELENSCKILSLPRLIVHDSPDLQVICLPEPLTLVSLPSHNIS